MKLNSNLNDQQKKTFLIKILDHFIEMSTDSKQKYDFTKFIQAQEVIYPRALKEIKNGKKISHWIWYIYPIVRGRRNSSTSRRFGISCLDEAREYMKNESLRNNLIEITEALLPLKTTDPHEIFGSPDDEKVCACMTLFSLAIPEETVFQKVLDKYYNGEKDQKTLDILSKIE